MVDEIAAVMLDRFARDREGVVHREHPQQLGIRRRQPDMKRVSVEGLQARNLGGIIGRFGRRGSGAEFVEPGDPPAKRPPTRRRVLLVRDPLEGIDEIVGGQLAPFSPALFEAWIILKINPRPDLEGVDQAVGEDFGQSFGQQWLHAVRTIQI